MLYNTISVQLLLLIPPCPYVACLHLLRHHFPPHLQSFPIRGANMSPAALKSNGYGDIFFDTCSKHEACWAAGRTEGGLSGMAGLASITMPIEKAAQSLALRSPIRPPDKEELQQDPTQYNGRVVNVANNPWQFALVRYFTFSLRVSCLNKLQVLKLEVFIRQYLVPQRIH